MKSKIFVWICFIISIAFLFLQCKTRQGNVIISQQHVPKTDDSIVFKQLRKNVYYHKADSFYNADVNDSAVFYYNKSLTDPNLPFDKKIKQEILNKIGYTYVRLADYKNARNYLTKALLFIESRNPDLISANTYDCYGVLCQLESESDTALYYLNEAHKIYTKLLGEQNMQIVKMNIHIGDLYRWNRFDYYNAEKYYYRALHIFESQGFEKKNDLYFRILYSLSSINRLKNDFNKSLFYGLQTLHLAQTVAMHRKYLEICYGLVANIYLGLKDYNQSVDYYKMALDLNSRSTKVNEEYKSLYLTNLMYAYNKLTCYKDAIDYGIQAFKTFNKKKPDYGLISSCYEYMGNSYQELNDLDKAYGFYKHCLAIRLQHLGNRHPKTASIYGLIGKLHAYKKDLDSALYYYQLALISGSPKFDQLKIEANPMLSEAKENVDLIDLLNDKASILKLKYLDNNKNVLSLMIALRCYELLDSLVSYSRKSMDTEQSKLSFSVTSSQLYEEAIDCSYQLYQLNKNTRYVDQSLRFFEKNKYLLLLEKLKMAEAGNKAGVPDSLIESEKGLNSELTFVQSKLASEQGKRDVNTQLIQTLNARIFTIMRSIEKLHGVFEQKYPRYFEVKYHDVNQQIEWLRKYSLNNGIDVIQYFWGEKFLYVIGTAGNHLNFFKINNSSGFRDSLLSVIEMMHEINFSSRNRFRDYTLKTYYLYNLLLKPALIGDNSQRRSLNSLTIIPDGLLSRLSFEALVTEKFSSSRFSYKSLPYLVNKYNLSYAYSSNILIGNAKVNYRKSSNKLLGFGYSGDDKNTQKLSKNNGLPGTMEEMKAISAGFKSRIFLGQDASECNFKKWVTDYDIIHLALHGHADEGKEYGSSLLFRMENDRIDDGMLNASEIYNLKLKAKLVVLSACETGLGKDYQGEGVFSMARAFAYAGCPSMVMSLWKVNDHSTAIQMNYFYKHLSDGEPINESLHQSKLEYLQDADEIAAQPVFWASFVALGDMSPVKQEKDSIIWILLSSIIAVVFLALWLYFKNKPKRCL